MMATNPETPRKQYKALCMHGLGTNSEIFETQTAALRQKLGAQFEWDFIEGSHPWPAAKGIHEAFGTHHICFSYYNGTAASAKVAIEDLAAYLIDNGPFHLIVGFSLGAAMVATLLLSPDHQTAHESVKSVAFLCATLPCDWQELRCGNIKPLRWADVSKGRMIQIPSVHAWSPKDVDYPGESGEVIQMFLPSQRVDITHNSGHNVPFKGEEVAVIAHAIANMVANTADS